MRYISLALALLFVSGAGDVPKGDWPMWGGTPDRNMVSNMKGLPTEWDVKTKKNIKWVADLGSQSYGNAVVSGGIVFVGTNNEGLRDPKQAGDRGVLMAFDENTGAFLWQHTHEKLASGQASRSAAESTAQQLKGQLDAQYQSKKAEIDAFRNQPVERVMERLGERLKGVTIEITPVRTDGTPQRVQLENVGGGQ